MKKELYDNLTEMCRQCDVSPRIECIILEMMQDAYHNGWEDAMNEKTWHKTSHTQPNPPYNNFSSNKQMKPILAIATVAVLGVTLTGCIEESSDYQQREQQERILQEGTAQTGMPAIKNFRERKLMKQIIEMRDQDGLVTYTYTVPETTGRPVFLCNSIGYGLPAATQYTNPQKYEVNGATLPQADPNGLFSPDSAEGTWVLCSDPSGNGKTRPVYVEPRIIVSPFKL